MCCYHWQFGSLSCPLSLERSQLPLFADFVSQSCVCLFYFVCPVFLLVCLFVFCLISLWNKLSVSFWFVHYSVYSFLSFFLSFFFSFFPSLMCLHSFISHIFFLSFICQLIYSLMRSQSLSLFYLFIKYLVFSLRIHSFINSANLFCSCLFVFSSLRH